MSFTLRDFFASEATKEENICSELAAAKKEKKLESADVWGRKSWNWSLEFLCRSFACLIIAVTKLVSDYPKSFDTTRLEDNCGLSCKRVAMTIYFVCKNLGLLTDLNPDRTPKSEMTLSCYDRSFHCSLKMLMLKKKQHIFTNSASESRSWVPRIREPEF